MQTDLNHICCFCTTYAALKTFKRKKPRGTFTTSALFPLRTFPLTYIQIFDKNKQKGPKYMKDELLRGFL
jgi:hypothetical protein